MKLPIFTLVLPILTIKCCTAMTHLNYNYDLDYDAQDFSQSATNTDSASPTELDQSMTKSITELNQAMIESIANEQKMRDFIDRHQEVFTGKKYIAPSSKEQIRTSQTLDEEQEDNRAQNRVIVEIAVKREPYGASGFTALGVNREHLFRKISAILQKPSSALYEKIKSCITNEIAIRCDEWLHWDYYDFPTLKDRVSFIWFIETLDVQNKINEKTKEDVQNLLNEVNNNAKNAISNEEKFGKTNELRERTAHPNRSAREIIQENLNAINDPDLYYVCVNDFLRMLLQVSEEECRWKDNALYALSFGGPDRLSTVIAIIKDEEIPVIVKEEGRHKVEIVKILNEKEKRRRTPRTWLIFNPKGRIFSKGYFIQIPHTYGPPSESYDYLQNRQPLLQNRQPLLQNRPPLLQYQYQQNAQAPRPPYGRPQPQYQPNVPNQPYGLMPPPPYGQTQPQYPNPQYGLK